MGKDVKKRFTVSLDIETKDVEKQVKATVGNLKTILADLGKASDKMGYFKELVDYIGQIDTALTALRAKNKDAFNHMFDGLDADLKKVMESIFDTSGKSMSALDNLRNRLNDASKNGAGVKELRQIAAEINALFTSLGRAEPIDIDAQFSGRGKTEDRIKLLTDALDNFATVWDGVHNKVKNGFGFEGTGGVVEFSEKVQKEIDALEDKIKSIQDLMTELQNVFKMTKAFSDGKDVPLGFEATEESAKNLLEQFKLLSATRQKFLEDGDTSSPAYYKNLIQYTKAATQLVALNDELAKSSKGSPKFLANALSGEFVDVYDFIESFDKKFVSGIQTSLSKIVSDAQTGIDKIKADALKNAVQGAGTFYGSGNTADDEMAKNKALAGSYEELSNKINEYYDILQRRKKFDEDSEEFTDLSFKLDGIADYIEKIKSLSLEEKLELNDIFGDLTYEEYGPEEALKRICNILQVEIPSAAKTAKKSLDGLGESTDGGAGGSSGGSGGTITNVDFTSLENTIKAEISSLSNKLDSVFKVEVVKNDTEDIKNAIDGVKSTIEKISAEIDGYNTLKKTNAQQAEVNAMKNNLTQLFKFVSEFNAKQIDGNYQHQEISAAILSDGSISTGYGEHGTVPWDRMASALVSNLTKSLMVDIHSHPWAQNGFLDRYANDSYSGSKGDLGAFRFSKELGAQMAAMITGNIMRTLDISKLTDEQMKQFGKALTQIEKTKANTPEYSKYMEYKNDKLYYHSQPTLDEQHKVTEAFESLMYEAFKQIGLSKDKVDKEIFKKYDLTDDVQLTKLAEHLVHLSQSSQNALSPVERLSEIISHFSGDVNSKTAKENFEAFTKGELTAAEVFNNLNRDGHTLNQETLDSLYKIDSANEMPVIESLLTQVVSALNAIESSVVNINNNTRQSTRDQFDTAINDILDIREGVNNKNILDGIKSIFDPLNISEYKNNEVLQIADGSILDAKDYIQDLFVKSHSEGSVSLDEMQIALDKFYLAMSNIQDAIKQVDLYEERTGKTHIDNAGEIAKYTLNDKYKEITDDNLLQQLLYLLSQAKVDISKSKEFYQGGFSGNQSDLDYDNGQVSSALQSIKATLDSIYGVLHGFTGIEADNKNALKYKEPVVDTNINRKEFSEQDLSVLNSILQVLQSIDGSLSTNKSDDVTEKVVQDNTDISDLVNFIKSKLSHQIATEDTLQAIKGAIEQVAELVKPKDENKTDDSEDIAQNLNTLISALTANVTTLKDVANGIVQHQKAQKSDTTKAMARIQDPKQNQIVSGLAKDAVKTLGAEVEIESLQALANGVVKVEGAFKNANDQWEGFTVKINEHNEAVDLAVKKHSALANTLNKAKDIDENTYQYNKEEVEARAQKHLEEYAAQGKNATVQFKDSGRYTITILEEIDGLSKQIFQTFDENDKKIERTTVTMSNSQKLKLENLQKKLIENGLTNDLISDKDNEYKNYQAAADALSNMTNAYSQMDNISDVEIANWKQQIALVQQLGSQVEALIKKRKAANDQEFFESGRTKELGKFNLDKAKLESNIDMTKISDKLKSDIADAGKAIANATDADSLKIAINNWRALKDQIEVTAVQQDLYIKKAKEIGGGNTKKGQAYGTSQLQNFTARYNSLIAGASEVGLNEQSAAVANLTNAYKQLQVAQSAFVAGEDKTSAEYANKIEVFKAAQFECNKYATELNNVVTASKKLASSGVGAAFDLTAGDFNLEDINGRESALKEYISSLGESVVEVGKFSDASNKLHYVIKNNDGTFTQMTATINKARTAIIATAGETDKASGKFGRFINELGGKFKSISTYFMASFGIEEVWQQLRQGVQYVREIDSALTELKKVTNETDASYDAFLQSMSKTGSVIGATVQDLTTMASEWARLGYSMEEAGKLAESTAILLNVSEFQDANAASEALISTMQAFKYTADDSQHVVDILNEIGNNYAVSSDGLAIALQDSASALMEAGNDLEQSVALVAAANKVLQDPNSVGSALRTISLRLRGTSVEVLEELGEETDGAVESVSKMQEKLKALTGVDILTDSGAYKDTYTILKEIAEVWDTMDPMNQAAALELMAGKNRANALAAILGNIEDLKYAYEDALNAEGSAMRENERYLESVQGHIDTFNNSLQTMWMNFLDTDAVKWFVHLGDAVIKLVDKFGVLQTAVAGFLTYLNISSNSKLDLASLLGIHELEESFTKGFSIIGKEGLTGGIVKSFNKIFKKNKKETIEVPISIEPEFEQVGMFSDEYMSSIQLNNKLGELRKAQDELKKLKSTKFKDVQIPDDALEYKGTPKRYLNKVLIPNKEAEIKAIEKDISDITNSAKSAIQNNFVELQNGQVKIDFDDFIDTESISSADLNDIFANFSANFKKNLDGKLIDFSDFETAAKQIDGFNDALGHGQTAFLNYLPQLNNADSALQSYLSSLNGGQASLQGFQAFIQQHNASVKASGVAAKAAAVGHQLLNAALSMGITMLASFAIDLVVKGLDKMITTTEEAAEAAEDAVTKYKDMQFELKTMDSTIAELTDDYQRLALGVDEFGNNINLTTAEYERYNQIVNQIADMFPEMVRGYTDEGNAIIKNKGNVEALTEAYKALKAEANNELLNNADNIMSTYKSTIDGSFWSWDNSTSEKISASQLLEKVLEEQDSFDFAKFNSEYRDKEYDTILSLLGDAGISREKSENNAEYVKRAVSEFPGIVQSIINSWDSVVDSAVSNVKPLVSAYLDTSIGYESLTDAQKSVFESVASAFDSNFFSQFDGDASKMYQTIENMILNLKSSGIDDEYTLILNTKTQFNNDEVTIGDYKKQVQEFVSQIEGLQEQGFLDENSAQYIKMSLGFDLDGNSEYDVYINRAKKILQDDYDDMTSELTLSDLQIIDQLDIPDGTVLTWDQLRQKIAEVKRELNSDVTSVQTYSELSTAVESYNEVLSQTSEIVSDNTEVTQEYKDSLIALGISEEELSECFDENNDLIVKNANKLKGLIKKQKDEYKNNVKTAKSQAKLKYYKLAKDLVNTVKNTKNLTNTQRDHIKAILEEMDAVQDTISKYNMLEAELLGVTNAYKKLADAQEIDSATDYGSKAEEMVNALASAFNTGELGTAAAEAAFEGLIPDWVVANAQSVDEAMQSAYNYMKSGALSNLFDIKYDDDGKLESVQMTLDKVKAFTSALTEADAVFHGTWDEFTLDPAIQNLDDFANAIGVTKEVAFAYLTELERYDASNIFGDSATGLLDQLMGDNFDHAMQQASQKYAQAAADMVEEFDKVNEKVDMFNRKILYDNEGKMVTMASETFKASDFGLNEDFAFNVTPILPDGTKLENVEDYIYDHLASGGKLEDMDIFLGSYATLDEAIAKGERLSELQGIYYENQLAIEEMENKALDFASAWGKTSDQLTDAREEAESLGRELAGAKNGVNESTGRTVEEIEADIKKNDQLISDLLSNLDKLKDEFGGEPTEMVVGVALDEVQEDIDNFKKDLEKKPAELKAAITEIDSTGFENLGLTKNADGSWSGLAELDWYQKLDPASQAEVTNYLNMVESEHYLNLLMGDGVPTIEEHLQTISTVLQDIARMMNPTYTLHADTANATNNVMTFSSWWHSLGDKVVTLYQRTIGSWFGGDNVNGTANVGGSAYAGGKWGAKQTETSLVGELGPEMVVRGNRWFTVGENGAEFTQVKKGDIIFNHKQTEELLKNGHVTGRGKAYASGTAYAGINTFTPYVPPVVSSGGNSNNDDRDDHDDDIADDSEQVVDFIEMKLEEIEAIIEKTSTRIANFLDDTTSVKSKDELYDELVKAEKDKSEAYLAAAQKYNVEAAAALSGVPQQYQEMARNGAIAIKDFIGEDQVEIAEKIEEYRDWAAKADEAENGHLEAIAAISAHRVEQLEDIATDFENIISISKSHSDLLQAEMDLIEESGNRLSESYYEELKKHSQKQLDDMQAEREALQKILDDSVASGDVVIGSDDWYSMLETIYEVDQEIVDCKTSLEEFQNAINELYWDNFDKLIDEIDNVDSELSNLFDLISDDDKVVDEMGNWTDEGITALGLLAQQMENAQFKAQEYGDAIDKLKKDYANGLYSTDEYNERLADLTDSQYDAIKSYEDSKDAIVDLNKTRAEAVKKYMQEEIDKYGELIEKKKESLNADKEARDFEKSVQESNKNIKDIERQIAALQGNTSSSAMAQRKRLEAELLKVREELNNLYYDHSIEKQQEALDKELEDYTKNKEDQMDALDEYLEKEEQVIVDSFGLIADNTKSVVDTLISVSEEYGVTISDTITTPWISGANAIGRYEEQLDTSVSATTANLETLKQQLEDLQAQADKTAESVVNATHSTVVETNDGHQTSIKGYAKGSKGVEYDQWALIDELGEELQLVPNSAGRLDYIKKGTGILNNTLTERLMNLAMDPTSMIENNRPVIGTPGITTTNNTIEIDASVGTLLHVEHLDGSNPAEVAKLVDKAWEKKMQTLNNSIKKFTR